MKRHPRASWSPLLIAGTPSFAGCGGSSTAASKSVSTNSPASSPAPASSLSRQAFVTKADAICQRLDARIARVKAKSASLREIERIAPPHTALEQAAASELGTLSPPAAIAREWRASVTYRRMLAEELLTLVQAAKANDSARIKALAASKLSVHKKLLAAGTHAGFKYCSQVG